MKWDDIKAWIYSPDCDCELSQSTFDQCCGKNFNITTTEEVIKTVMEHHLEQI